jgi:hypothetical protein
MVREGKGRNLTTEDWHAKHALEFHGNRITAPRQGALTE